ncbi:MAG: ATP-dependent helicase HrpB [Acidobacteria bacterium]|nr:ATP-dependent helicase HrpB [Acidobacteriota bacterium]
MQPLPIDPHLPDLVGCVHGHALTLVQAEPGSGKTTRVPPALAAALGGRVLVLEPRRLAARLAARRAASEAGEEVGGRVGYRVRFEGAESPATRVLYLTEGLFPRRLLDDPRLEDAACVVLDEFHERSLHADAAFALVRHLQATTRPDLRLVVMSATLGAEGLAGRFGGAAFRCGGTVHPVTVEHAGGPSDRPLPMRVAAAVAELAGRPDCPGHVLVFLPGIAEIRRAGEALKDVAERAGLRVTELWADLPPAEQAAVFAPSGRRKVILATNVAETSVTVEGVTGVVDSGLARIPGHAPWSGLPTLDVRPVSRASAVQRVGRAGRTAPGVVKRLYTLRDFEARREAEAPEVLRLDLSQLVLELHAVTRGLEAVPADLRDLPWPDPPPPERWDAAAGLLRDLGALDADGGLTAEGERMSTLPLHPRLSRVVAEGLRRACPAALGAAVLVNEGMVLRRGVPAADAADSDVSFQLERLRSAAAGRRGEADRHLDRARVERVREAVRRLAPALGWTERQGLGRPDPDALAACFLAGFPDRVASVRRREWGRQGMPDRIELQLCVGGGALLSPESVVRNEDWLIAVDAEDAPASSGGPASARVQTAVGISPELLVEAGGAWLRESEACAWNGETLQAEGRRTLCYGALVLESRPLRGEGPALEAVLRRALEQAWPKPFPDEGPLRTYAGRRAFLRSIGRDPGLPDLAGDDRGRLLDHLCAGRHAFRQIALRSLEEYLRDLLDPSASALLEQLAPRTVTVGAGRRVAVHYEDGPSPWAASRIQDFFGTVKPPRVGGGAVPLTLHLLAPNHRPVQVTADLDGFWDRAYPELRRRLSRRYPKHDWPEDPRSAAPPGRRG